MAMYKWANITVKMNAGPVSLETEQWKQCNTMRISFMKLYLAVNSDYCVRMT